jgi:hypothetical protein
MPARPDARVCMLSRHFMEEFRIRIGEEASVELVNRLLAGSKRIRKQQALYKKINGEFKRYEFLGEFWNHEAGLILVINEQTCKAVTVYTHRDKYPERPRAPFGAR